MCKDKNDLIWYFLIIVKVFWSMLAGPPCISKYDHSINRFKSVVQQFFMYDQIQRAARISS